MAPPAAALSRELRLPYGLAADGRTVEWVRLRVPTGGDELALAEASGPVAARVALIARCAVAADGPLGERAAALTLGDAEIVLRGLFALMEGAQLEGWIACPACTEMIVFDVDLAALVEAPPEPGPIHRVAGRPVRLPTLADLAASALAADPAAALADRCGAGVARPTLGAALARLDPNADCRVALACPACAAPAEAALDGWALVRERTAGAETVFRDVDAIARAYGWSERAILALPVVRRRRYVALAQAE